MIIGATGSKRSDKSRSKISKALKGKKHTEERKKNISDARTIEVEQKWLDKLDIVWSKRYILDYRAVVKHINFPYSGRVYNRLLKKLSSKYRIIKFVPLEVQMWDYEKMESFIKDAQKISGRKIMSKYGFGIKTAHRLLNKLGIKWIRAPVGNKETYIERIVREFFQSNAIEFDQEFLLDRYHFDFRVGNTLIEVQGDYWHCNPRVYKEPINKNQIRSLANDAMKYQCAIANKYRVIYVWEYDLNRYLDQTLRKMEELINGNQIWECSRTV